MKEIRAYIQPFMLPKLTQALLEIQGFPGMSVTDCEGFGRAHVAVSQNYNPFVAKKRVEIFVPDDMAEQVFAAVMKHANTHQHGAGNRRQGDGHARQARKRRAFRGRHGAPRAGAPAR